mmetsp:Transcript_39522/g.85319  ORF Transcript_39522/g.85319 Transcript_39522/m.85319 type:complete len:213 (-) Transcript_39522:363-1001(-)
MEVLIFDLWRQYPVWLQPTAIAPFEELSLRGDTNHVVLATGEVHHLVSLQRQRSHQTGEALRRVHVTHSLFPQAQLTVVVPSPNPQLALLAHRGGEVFSAGDFADPRRVTWFQNGVICVLEVVNDVEINLVIGIAPSQASEIPLARGIEMAILRQHHGVLCPTSDHPDLHVFPAEVFHAAGTQLGLAVTQAQGPNAVEKTTTPTPGPQRSVL